MLGAAAASPDRAAFGTETSRAGGGAVLRGWPLRPRLTHRTSGAQSVAVIFVEQSVQTSASAQRVWEVLTDHESMSRWFPPVKKVTLDPPGREERNGLGAVRHIQAAGPTVVEEVVEWDAPRRYVYVLLRGAPIRDHRGEVSVVETDEGARATWKIQFRPLIPLTGVVLRPFMARLAGELLRRAVKFAEAS